MHDVLIFALWLMGFMLVGSTVCSALAVRSLRRANRVVAGRRTAAPLSWLWSWRQPARLHRRLPRAVSIANAAAAPPLPPSGGRRRTAPLSPLSALADELAEQALAIDDRLAAAGRVRALMPRLAREVGDVERGAQRLSGLAASWRIQIHQAALTEASGSLDFGSRLEAYEAAMAELGQARSAR